MSKIPESCKISRRKNRVPGTRIEGGKGRNILFGVCSLKPKKS
jgi:hypothetical protein